MLALLFAIFQFALPMPAQAALTEFDFECSVYSAREADDTQLWARAYRDIFRVVVKGGKISLYRGDLHGPHKTVGEKIKWHVVAKNAPVTYVKAKTRANYPYMLPNFAGKAETLDRWTTGFTFNLDGSEIVGFLTSSNRSNRGDDQIYSGDMLFPEGLELQDGAVVYNIHFGFCFDNP